MTGLSCSNVLIRFLCDISILVRGARVRCNSKQVIGAIFILLTYFFGSLCSLSVCLFVQSYILEMRACNFVFHFRRVVSDCGIREIYIVFVCFRLVLFVSRC